MPYSTPIDMHLNSCTQYFTDRFIGREINNLKVVCSFHRAGCKWNVTFQDYEEQEYNDHGRSCPFRSSLRDVVSPFISQASPPEDWSLESEMFKRPVQESQNIGRVSTAVHLNPPLGRCTPEVLYQRLLALEEKVSSLGRELTSLEAQVTRLEKQTRQFRNFHLPLNVSGTHDGSIIWKIPEFTQRKADAEDGKYTSPYSLPFYSGRYGYKMCLRLYIMGDGIGKGTHLSLFFVVMRGEFDNILQWPFTHKVTFKLINQAGGRDIVNTFQPDPMSSSFRKPKSDMNIASGCPRFVSHTELERGGFIDDDTVFIKCMIDTSTIRHP